MTRGGEGGGSAPSRRALDEAAYRIQASTLADHLDRAADRWSHDALAFEEGTRATFPELAERSRRRARELRALGVDRGDTVGILMTNRIEYIEYMFGAARLGAIPIPVNSRFKVRELGYVVANGEMRVIVTTAGDSGGGVDYAELLAEALPGLARQDPRRLRLPEAPALRQVVTLDAERAPGCLPQAELDDEADRVDPADVAVLQARVRVRDVGMIMYTSGTTANPKGCMLSHEALVRVGYASALTRFLIDERDRVWDPLPLFHMSTILPLNACLAVGATFVAMTRFDADAALDQLEGERITFAFPAFETIWLAVLNHPRFGAADLSHLRLVNNVGVPERLAAMQSALPTATQISSFGATEGGGVVAFNHPDDPLDRRLHTSGHPMPGIEVRIVDPETGEDLPPGERGEILYRGFSVFDGYFRDPELTAEAIDADGWFRTGDLGTLDAEGRISFLGRLKDMLKVGGENVAAAEIEGFIVRHPAVNIVQVVAAPDGRYIEVPAAFIELKQGETATERELIDFCLGRIATFKVPRYVRFVDDWPMSGTKIQKFRLRERIAAELAERGITEAPRMTSRASAADPGAEGTRVE